MQISPLMLVIAGAIIWTIGDLFVKVWVGNEKFIFVVVGILIWAVGLIFLAETFRSKNMAVASIMMVTLNSILLVLITWLFFKEHLTVTQLAGMTFGLVGLYFLEIG